MNRRVFLDVQAGELEKILSGVKTMLVKEFVPAHPICQGDSLFFLRDREDCTVRVKAAVAQVLYMGVYLDGDLSQVLKELQHNLHLTEDQYNAWSAKQQVLLVKLDAAQKVDLIHVSPGKTADRSDWISFATFDEIT